MSQLNVLEPKDPNDIVDYQIDWSKWLPPGDVILTSEWIVPAGITMDSETNADTTTTIWLRHGTAGSYSLTNRIFTAQGRQKDCTIIIRVAEQ